MITIQGYSFSNLAAEFPPAANDDEAPKKKAGRKPVTYDNSRLVDYVRRRKSVILSGERAVPLWLEDVISGAIVWDESIATTKHKLSPHLMRSILTTMPTITTAEVQRVSDLGKRGAQYYVKAATVASELAIAHIESERFEKDKLDRWVDKAASEDWGEWDADEDGWGDWSGVDEVVAA